MPAFTNASNVRAYAGIDAINAQDDRWNEGPLGSNIRAASAFLQKRTGRQFELQLNATKKFTTNGSSYISVPDLATITSISRNGTTLTVDTDVWSIAESSQGGNVVGLQFQAFGNPMDYRSRADWFDRNLDRFPWRVGSEPNDLTITGDWGYVNPPEELVHATNVLAAWYTRRPDSLLGGVSVTAQGTEIDMGALPVEVKLFIEGWKIGSLVASGG